MRLIEGGRVRKQEGQGLQWVTQSDQPTPTDWNDEPIELAVFQNKHQFLHWGQIKNKTTVGYKALISMQT